MTVILVTLDGVRPDAIQQANTPNLDRVMATGAYTLTAQSVLPSITLPCHMSIFHSVPPERHGVLTNGYHPMARPILGLFEQVHNAGKRCAMVYGWEPLRDVARPLSLSFGYFSALDFDNLPEADTPIVEMGVELIASQRYDLLFVYIGATDEIGHLHGWMSDLYLRQVEIADGQVGLLLAAMTANDTILIESDHGGRERMHGFDSPEEMTIPWMISGAGIKCGVDVQQAVTLLDTAPTLAHLLGVPAAGAWEGQIVSEALITPPTP